MSEEKDTQLKIEDKGNYLIVDLDKLANSINTMSNIAIAAMGAISLFLLLNSWEKKRNE